MLRLTLVTAALLFSPMMAPAQTVPGSQAEITLSYAPVVKKAIPAVVNIYATVVVERRATPFAGDPFFDQFFRDFGRTAPRVQNSLGSGVIVSPEGIVVSNYHVVRQATEIRVELSDRREYRASVLLADEEADLAILQLDGAKDLPALALRESDTVEVGELALAIGNPFGVGQTVSAGIISGLGRSTLAVGGGRSYFVQTDAAINPGNSGGALVDMQGRLIGINTAIVTRGGGSNGIGFAIPADLVRNFIEQAKAGETRFQRPWAGVSAQVMDAAMAEALGLSRPEGVVISALHPESPFGAAGLVVGDVILAIDDEPTDTPQSVMFRLASRGIGQEVTVRYLHREQEAEVRVTLIAPPETPPRDTRLLSGDTVLRGVTVSRINPAVVAEFDLPDSMADGVVVAEIGDTAARTGLRVGDVLIAINGEAVTSVADVEMLTQPVRRRWSVEVLRNGRPILLRFRI